MEIDPNTKITLTLQRLKDELKNVYMIGTLGEPQRQRREKNFEIYWRNKITQLLWKTTQKH